MRAMNFSNKIKIILAADIIVSIAAGVISYALIMGFIKSKTSFPVVNNARLAVAKIETYVESNYEQVGGKAVRDSLKAMLKRDSFKLKLIALDGKVFFNSEYTGAALSIERVNIREALSYDLSFKNKNNGYILYTEPVVIGERQVGNAVFNLPAGILGEDEANKKAASSLLPVFISILIGGMMLILLYRLMARNIIRPLKSLNICADEIARGNLEYKISFDTSSRELGKFCSSFEFMRDELKYSIAKQQEIEESRKELIACISHDLRTPLASIKAYVKGIQDGLARDGETLNRYIDVIGKKTDSLSKLIQDLFQHAQADMGELSINKTEQYSLPLFNKIIDSIGLELKGTSIDFKVTGTIPNVLINVDPMRIEQVIMNLVQNSKKYSSAEGAIEFSCTQTQDTLSICIKDTGWGIAPGDIPYIFDRFYRGDKSRSTDSGGAGLGLYICKNIIEAHGGEIFVNSTQGKGSSFYITLPKEN